MESRLLCGIAPELHFPSSLCLILFDAEEQAQEQIDMALYSFEALKDLMQQHGCCNQYVL